MIKELMQYALTRINGYHNEKNKESFFAQYSQQLNDPREGTVEIKAPRKYNHKKRLERRLETSVREFYSRQGFHLASIPNDKGIRGFCFEREINLLERYLISIERQGIYFYIHVIKK